jgi:hypothetical protein
MFLSCIFLKNAFLCLFFQFKIVTAVLSWNFWGRWTLDNKDREMSDKLLARHFALAPFWVDAI